MASTYSALKIELLETGANSGTWGTLTNVNLGDAMLGEVITGSATVNYATDADVTITLTDVSTTQSARNLRLNITETSTGVGSVRNLILGSGCQIEKFYLIKNTGTGAKTVKNTSGNGISVPAGKSTLVYNDGTDVVDAASYFTSLTLGSALPVASGGSGETSYTNGQILIGNTTGNTLTKTTLTAGSNVTITNGTGSITIAAAGAGDVVGPASATDNAITRFDLTTGKLVQNSSVTIADDGAITAPQVGSVIPFYWADVASFPSASTYHGAIAHAHSTGAMYFAHGGVWTRLLDDSTDVTVAQGGTGLSTLTANNVILGNGTSTPLFVAPSTSGNVLTSNGTTWQSTAASGATKGQAIAFSMIFGL